VINPTIFFGRTSLKRVAVLGPQKLRNAFLHGNIIDPNISGNKRVQQSNVGLPFDLRVKLSVWRRLLRCTRRRISGQNPEYLREVAQPVRVAYVLALECGSAGSLISSLIRQTRLQVGCRKQSVN